jgi:hypothetical protein
MWKLVSEVGTRWATKENAMIFSNVVWLMDEKEKNTYHLVDKNLKDLKVCVDDYLVNE